MDIEILYRGLSRHSRESKTRRKYEEEDRFSLSFLLNFIRLNLIGGMDLVFNHMKIFSDKKLRSLLHARQLVSIRRLVRVPANSSHYSQHILCSDL